MLQSPSMNLVRQYLAQFAATDDFESKLISIYGQTNGESKLSAIKHQWLNGDFSIIPEIEILSAGELGTANGAYAASLDKIFVSSDFLALHQDDAAAIAELLLEEIGHKVDVVLNGSVDSPGDEGAIFRLLVSGYPLTDETLAGLRGQDDHAVIIVDGQAVAVEQQDFYGTTGNDNIVGTAGDDNFIASTGKDTIDGGAGKDIFLIIDIYNPANNTIFYTNTVDGGTITDGFNNSTTFKNIESVGIYTGLGNDFIDASTATNISGVTSLGISGGGGNDTIIGSATSRNDFLSGGDGNDSITGGSSIDSIDGGAGNDTLNGGAGDDFINSGTGADSIDGGAGNDTLIIGNIGVAVNNTLVYTNTVDGGKITGGLNDGTTFKNIESVNIFTDSGNDFIDASAATNIGGVIHLVIAGGAGNDTIIGSATTKNDFLSGDAGNDSITGGTGDDGLNGGDGNDTLIGGAGNDVLLGGAGNDSLDGGTGDDILDGDDGNDTLIGGAGNDSLNPGKGADSVDGGAGNDFLTINNTSDAANTTIIYADATTGGRITGGFNDGTIFKNVESIFLTTGSGNDRIDMAAVVTDFLSIVSGSGNDTIIGSATSTNYVLDGGDGNDSITGGAISDNITGGAGDDTLDGGAGDDRLDGGVGNDLLIGGAGDDNLSGGDGNDSLIGGAGSDSLTGGAGDDVLSGVNVDSATPGLGEVDTLTGGAGKDRFILGNNVTAFYDDGKPTSNGATDYALITDFNPSEDVIELFGTKTNYALVVSGANTNLYIDKPGTEPDELIATISGVTGLDLNSPGFVFKENSVFNFSKPTFSGKENSPIAVTVNRTGATTTPASVTISLQDGTATYPSDYTQTAVAVDFAAGETSKIVALPIVQDTIFEPDETLNLSLTNPTNGTTIGLQNAAVVTIVNPLFGILAFSSPTYSVKEDGTTTGAVTITRTGGKDGAVSATVTLQDGTATSPSDYNSTPITVNFADGEVTKTVNIPIVNDTIVEPDETIQLILTNPTGGVTIGQQNTAVLTILDDDVAPVVLPTITIAKGKDAAEPSTNGSFILTRTGADNTAALTVNLDIPTGTATNGVDYTTLATTATFAAGSATATVNVIPIDDTLIEGTETIGLVLKTGNGYVLGATTSATINLADKEILGFNFSKSTFSGKENSPISVTLNRTGDTTTPASVTISLQDGTATYPSDYTQTAVAVDFAAGETSKIVALPIVQDTIFEPDETLNLSLTNPTNGTTIGTQSTAVVTIVNPLFGTLAFSSPTFRVREDGTTTGVVTIYRTGGTDGAVSATVKLQDGTATSPSDYNNTPITVNFADGEVTKRIELSIVNDTILEPDETLQLILTNPTGGANIGQQNTATVTIVDKSSPIITGLPQGSMGSNKGQATIVIAGQNFSPTDQISIIAADGTTKTATKTYWVNPTEIWATFDLQGSTIGQYNLKVQNSQNSGVSSSAFYVVDGVVGNVNVRLSYPTKGVVTVNYSNIGQTDVAAPLFKINATNAQVTYPDNGITSPSLSQLLSLGFGTSDNGPAGILAPGKRGDFSFAHTPNGNGLINFAVEQVKPTDIIDWASIKAQSRTDYSFIDADAWDALWSNLTANLGQTYGQFQAVMTENANYLSQLGEPTSNLARLFAFEWEQADNTLTNTNLLNSTDVVDAAPGLSLTFSRTFHQSLTERYKLGSLGRGWSSQWDLRATTDTKGNVIVRSNGNLQRIFEKQTDGTFTTVGGATLTIINGQYRIKELSGLVSLFGTDGKLNYVEDPSGNRITLEYTTNLLTKLVHTNGDSLALTYNAQGRLNQITDSTGKITSYSYDTSGEHLLSVTSPDGTNTYTYETGTVAAKKHSLLSVSTDLGYQRSFEYDNQGHLTKEYSNGQTQTLTYNYDSTGGVTITDSTGATQTVLLDERGNGGQIRGTDNQNLVFSYDASGNVIGATLPDGSKSSYSYDKNGNLTNQINPLGQETTFSYDPTFGQLSGFTDAKGNGVGYSYDPKGNLTKITYADGSSEQFSIDALGNVTSTVNRRGSTSQYTYDSSGLLTKKQSADGAIVTYAYDPTGNLTGVTDATGTIAMEYDPANQLTKITYPTGRSLAYTYNTAGQRTKLVSSDGYTTNYSYDTVGRLKTLTDAAGQSIVSYEYDSAGRLTKETNGNGTFTTYEYDAKSQLTKLVNRKADNTVNSQFEYTYDILGRRTSMTTLEGKFSYGYDAIGQLTSVVTPTNRTIAYQYDAAGNRTTVADNGVISNYGTNNLNEYTTVGSASYTYDKDGNLTGKTQGADVSTYTYNDNNQLTKVVTAQGTWEYQYDELGDRIATTKDGQRTDYLIDPTGLGDVVGEYNGNTLVANYTQGIGLVSRSNGSNTNYYDADALGSTVGLTAADGSYVNRYSYLPFGESLTKVEGVANPFEYVGQWGVTNEGNGLNFMRARFYDFELGRFTSVDPLGVSARDNNLYRYVFNSPIQNNDPSGKFIPIIAAFLGGAALGAVSDIAIQIIPQLFSDEEINIDWGSVGSSFLLGGVGGGTGAWLKNSTKVSGQVFSHWFPERWGKKIPKSNILKQLFDKNKTLGRLNGQYVSQKFHYWTDYFATIKGLSKEAYLGQKLLEGYYRNKDRYINFNLIPRIPLWIVNSLLFPLIPKLIGGSKNDPHLQTLDNVGYDFQAVGEFTLVKSTTDNFEIQTRQQPWRNSINASANTAITVKIGDRRIALYADQTQKLVIDGTPVTLADGGLYAVGQNLVTRNGSTYYSIITANNDLILIDDKGTFLNVNLGLADNRKGKVVGLLGNFNDNRDDDFALRNGTALGSTLTKAQLYGEYGNSWRITQATSLFDYAAGTSTDTFTNLNFPSDIITIDSLTPAQRAAAEQIARDAGITDPAILNDAIVDIFLTNGAPEFIQGALSQQRLTIVNAPNTLINTDGVGAEQWVTDSSLLPYTIRFSNNTAQGSIPVAKVTISEQLDTDLDLNTFNLNKISFGDINIDLPNGTKNYSQRLDLRTTKGLFVDITAELNPATYTVTWTLSAIDPITGNPVDSVTKGFLPPNDTNGAGSGFVGYSIQPKANSANRTRIDAQATITFNAQTPLQTNPVANLLDSEAPTSKVTALPATSDKEFTVAWTGTDTGSGIATYNVYVSIDSGAYTLWQTQTTQTTATYTGEVGKTYSFYSVATDRLGKIEVKNPTAETTTKLAVLVPTISVIANDPNAAETKTGEIFNPGQFTITRTGDFTQSLTANYVLSGTATNSTDYQPLPGTITFAAGKDTGTIDLNVIDDNIFEGAETAILSITANAAYILSTANTATVNIADNDPQPTVSIGDVSINEGNSSTTNATFTISLSNPSTQPITVDYATSDGTAKAGTDYTKVATTTLTFAPGETSKTITVGVIGNTVVEADKTFKVDLSNATNATLSTAKSGTGTILNDDILPSISVIANDPNAAETKTGEIFNPGQFTFTRTGDLIQSLTANYALSGTATNSTDYQTLLGTVTFAAGKDTGTIDLNVIDDNIFEGTETAILSLTANAAYTLATANTATVNIADNDTRPTISISDANPATGKEGDPAAKDRAFTISLSNPSTETISVQYSTVDGAAKAGSDYTATNGSSTFNPGETSKSVNVSIIDDAIFEDTETFKVQLTNPTNATLAQTEGTATILDDDLPAISLIVTDDAAAETKRSEIPNPGQFTLKRNGSTTNPLTVKYCLTGTATNGTDYEPLTNTITFAAGSDTATIDINVIDDKIYEGDETINLKLCESKDYTITGKDTGTVTIADNDAKIPQLYQPNPHLLEIEGGTEKSLLKFTKMAHGAAGKNEVCAFTVDDAQGTINGIKPGDKGYLAAAIDKAQVIFSSLGNNSIDKEFDSDTQRYLNFTPGDRVELLMVVDSTLNQLKADLTNGKPTANVLFSLPEANTNNYTPAQFTDLPNSSGYQIGWNDTPANGQTNSRFNDLVLKVETLDGFMPTIGTGLQGKSEGKVIDLSSFAGRDFKIDTTAVSDAAYNNYFGFYAVADAQGTLANGLKPNDFGYAEAAIKSAVMRSFKNETHTGLTIAGGQILAPVAIANGTFDDFLKPENIKNDANSKVHAYFNYIGANTDKVDHFRLLGDNKFGVEDLYGGGDRDYNDIVFQVTIKG